MGPRVDEPAAVNPEAAFELGPLSAWLREREAGLQGEAELFQFRRGYSNLTYLVRFGARELVVRRAPPGVDIKSAHDMGREFRILRALVSVWPKVAEPIAHCPDPSVIGTPFYVMERVAGVILRGQAAGIPGLDAETMKRLSHAACDTLAEIHRLDWRAAGLEDLGKPAGYVERQVRGWSDRWGRSKTEEMRDMEKVIGWLTGHLPAESGAALVHNDFKYDNLVLYSDLSGVRAVLDWEMATLGDPLMDLGTALGYWVQADDPPILQVMTFGPTSLPGNLTRAEFAERYSQTTGRNVNGILFYYVFALFKLAVVAQQLYKRYALGLTREERYAMMVEGVRALAALALIAVDKGRIDRLA